jgi:4-amino-4-deoxy-L-arabinose transferase-like glycosyltransferase
MVTEQENLTIQEHAASTTLPGAKWWIVSAFFFCWLPFAANFVTFHPDERHYTDGAMYMLHSGDYLTPYTPEGQPRLRKPVLTYWLLIPGYGLAGMHPLAGRIPFLILATASLGVVYAITKMLYHEKSIAQLGLAIMATHIPLLTVAVHSLPEVPLTLAWLVTAWGFLGIIACGKRTTIFYWLAYGGAGFGVAVKGMPLLLLVAYAWAFVIVVRPHKCKWKDLLHWPSMLGGAMLGGWWYMCMLLLHGSELPNMLLADQVTERIGLSPVVLLKNFGYVILGLIVAYFPWNISLLRNSRTRNFSTNSVALLFVLGWMLCMSLVVTCMERFAFRYLLALTPLGIPFLAAQLNTVYQQNRWISQLAYVCITCAIVTTGVACLIACWGATENLFVISYGLIMLAALICFCFQRAWQQFTSEQLWTLSTLLVLPCLFFGLQPIVLPDSGQKLAQTLKLEQWLGRSGFIFVGNPALISKARIWQQGELDLFVITDREDLAIEEYPHLLMKVEDAAQLPAEAYRVDHEFAAGYKSIQPLSWLAACCHGDSLAYLQQRQQNFVIVSRKSLLLANKQERSNY